MPSEVDREVGAKPKSNSSASPELPVESAHHMIPPAGGHGEVPGVARDGQVRD